MRILITGIGGTIGRLVAQDLSRDHVVTGLDLKHTADFPCVVADLADRDLIYPCFSDVDVVIHLAAERRHTRDIGWDSLMQKNVVATANVFDVASAQHVRRMVFASSMHVMGLYEDHNPYLAVAQGRYSELTPGSVPLIDHAMAPRPDGKYAVSKLFGETLGQYYSEAEGMEVVNVRLGTLSGNDRPGPSPRDFVSWLSHRDAAGIFRGCAEQPRIRYETIYAASANYWKIYDTPRTAEVVGYHPVDNAEAWR